jgi:hypothetical protein
MASRSRLAAALIAIGLLAGACGGETGSEPGGPAPVEEEPAEDGGLYD